MVSLRLVLSGLFFKKIVPIIKNQAVNLHTKGRMKSQRAYQILVVFLLILPVRIFSQQQMPLFAQKIPHSLKLFGNFKTTENQNDSSTSFLFTNNEVSRPFTLNPFPFRMEVINTNFTFQNLPFFCKKEFQFEKNTAVPLRVRLGSLDYVNKLEGKDNHLPVVPGN
jgi:hypothetical protein